jgi:hypothetical protein
MLHSSKLASMIPGSQQGNAEEDLTLLGRGDVYQELLETLRAVRKGTVQTVVLSGLQGSGKTIVLDRFLEYCRSAARGVQVLSATGDEWEAQFPLAGYSQLMATPPLRTAANDAPAGAPSPDSPDALSPGQVAKHASTFMAHLEGLQAQSTVVVAVDDIQNLDSDTLHVLVFSMRRLRDKRILFVVTLDPAHSQFVPAGVLAFFTGHQVSRLPLEPLSPQEVQNLARLRFGIDLSATAAHGIVQHTRGLPQPVVELLDELPPETWQSWFSSLPPSSRVRARVRSLLNGVSADLVAVAEAASVLRESAGIAEVAHVSGVRDVMDALDEGHRAGLLGLSVEQARSVVKFFEAGTTESVYEQIVPSRRIELHRRAAETVQVEGDRLGHRVSASPGADENLAAELEEYARRQAMVGAWRDVSTALFSASRLSNDIRTGNDRLLRAVDALVGAGNMAQAQMWAAAVDAMPPSPLRSSVLGYLSIASGQNHSAQTQLEMAWRTSNPERDPAAAAQVAQRLVVHGVAHGMAPL